MQLQCRERSEQLSVAAMQLREESASLREQCEATQLDMARIRQQLDELLQTKKAFEARERQARKLSKHLWEHEEEGANWSHKLWGSITFKENDKHVKTKEESGSEQEKGLISKSLREKRKRAMARKDGVKGGKDENVNKKAKEWAAI